MITLAAAPVVNVPILLFVPFRFNIWGSGPPEALMVPAPLRSPVMVTVFVVVLLKDNVPAIVAVPPTLNIVAVVPKSNVPAAIERLFETVTFANNVLVFPPDIVRL